MVCFHLYDIFLKSKPMHTKSRFMVVCKLREEKGVSTVGKSILLGVIKCFKIWLWWCFYNSIFLKYIYWIAKIKWVNFMVYKLSLREKKMCHSIAPNYFSFWTRLCRRPVPLVLKERVLRIVWVFAETYFWMWFTSWNNL